MDAFAKGNSEFDLHSVLKELCSRHLRTYKSDPGRLKEDFGHEETVLAGGYGYRQVMELVQNGADAILEAHEGEDLSLPEARLHVVLRDNRLYVANTGAPLRPEGLDALLRAHSSPKRGNQIGRFGLGFKSLLKLGGVIDVFTRRHGAIRFDPGRCRRELRETFGVEDVPGLRLAWPLRDAGGPDGTLSQMSWAETVIRVEVRQGGAIEQLRQEIERFPAEFLLFVPVSLSLTLEADDSTPRAVEVISGDGIRTLQNGDDVSIWRVSHRDVVVADQLARDDATGVHARDSVPLAWAIPIEGRREEAGRFWAFFPTDTPSFVPGILNAPWKLNSDRNAVIAGDWNAALMKEAARMIAEALPGLASSEDPGGALDAFPRQLDRANVVAAPLIESLWEGIETAPVIPDVDGVPRTARSLWRHPVEDAELAEEWVRLASTAARPVHVHPSCYRRQRNSRLSALADRLADADDSDTPKLQRRNTSEWFQDAASEERDQSLAVLHLVDKYAREARTAEWHFVRATLRIIPTDAGELVRPSRAVLAPAGTIIPGLEPVASWLYDDVDARRVLKDVLNVKTPDNNLWESVLSSALSSVRTYPLEEEDRSWRQFWVSIRVSPSDVAEAFLQRKSEKIRVLRRDGRWVPTDIVLLPGKIVQADDETKNQKCLVDLHFHLQDRRLLRILNVTDELQGDVGPVEHSVITSHSSALRFWQRTVERRYRSNLRGGSNPRSGYLEPFRLIMPAGWKLMSELSGLPNARLTRVLLNAMLDSDRYVTVDFGHATRTDAYPIITVSHPVRWLLFKHGSVAVGDSVVPLAAVAARWRYLRVAAPLELGELEPVYEALGAEFPELKPSAEALRTMWRAVFAGWITAEALADESLASLWATAAQDGVVPSSFPSANGAVPLSRVLVTSSSDLARYARRDGLFVVALDEATRVKWIADGARDCTEVLQPEWNEDVAPSQLVTTVLPELGEVLEEAARESLTCQPVSDLRLRSPGSAQAVPCLMWKGKLFLDLEQLKALKRTHRLLKIFEELEPAGCLLESPLDALQRLGDAQVDELRASVARESTLAERLARAVGNQRGALLGAMESLADRAFIQQCSIIGLAELVLAHHGPSTLSKLREALEDEGLKPPARWGTSEAASFVASVGFPAEFASSSNRRLDPEEVVSGPIELPNLHDFQKEVLNGIEALLRNKSPRRRAVVSLPTGGGKTRVTVEAAVKLVLVPQSDRRAVVWIAQTNELCEQAVQAFRQVWVNVGAEKTDLRIVRLWGGNPNPARPVMGRPTVVVASIQTLNSRLGAAGLEWLQQPGLVVVDECHHAITPSYSNLLRWLDAGAPNADANADQESPIIGLSATPFRTDDEESRRLARRFDQRWLPTNQERLHLKLRDQGVLATINSEALESGVPLLPEELERLSELEDSFEGIELENLLTEINQRLAGNEVRNQRLLGTIAQATEKSILFFANSVAHAEEISARLNLTGISAAAISGGTSRTARRYFIDRFQRGDIRVLCNHTVLSTGFDAPKTDLLIISRTVFSPVRYMQMVGRGMRGIKNGGTESCRIVTVLDNLGRFGDRHPYHYCQRYFA